MAIIAVFNITMQHALILIDVLNCLIKNMLGKLGFVAVCGFVLAAAMIACLRELRRMEIIQFQLSSSKRPVLIRCYTEVRSNGDFSHKSRFGVVLNNGRSPDPSKWIDLESVSDMYLLDDLTTDPGLIVFAVHHDYDCISVYCIDIEYNISELVYLVGRPDIYRLNLESRGPIVGIMLNHDDFSTIRIRESDFMKDIRHSGSTELVQIISSSHVRCLSF